eukprot:124473_1
MDKNSMEKWDVLIFILWIISFQQLCITSKFNRKRGIRACFHSLFSICGILLNTLTYLSLLHPNYQVFPKVYLSELTSVLEGFLMIFGFCLFHTFQLSIINQLYLSVNMYPAKWIKKLFKISPIIFIIIVINCYGLQFVTAFHKFNLVNIFYMLLGFIIVIIASINLYIYFTLLKYFNNTDNKEIQSAKNVIKFAIFIVVTIQIAGIFTIFIETLIVWPQLMNFSFKHEWLINTIFLVETLILSVYRKHMCCVIPQDSICIVWGCGNFDTINWRVKTKSYKSMDCTKTHTTLVAMKKSKRKNKSNRPNDKKNDLKYNSY